MNDEEMIRTFKGNLVDYIRKLKETEEKNIKLQSNWNSLREWLEKQKEDSKNCKKWNSKKGFNDIDYERDIKRFEFVLDKMNELEGVDNEISSIRT